MERIDPEDPLSDTTLSVPQKFSPFRTTHIECIQEPVFVASCELLKKEIPKPPSIPPSPSTIDTIDTHTTEILSSTNTIDDLVNLLNESNEQQLKNLGNDDPVIIPKLRLKKKTSDREIVTNSPRSPRVKIFNKKKVSKRRSKRDEKWNIDYKRFKLDKRIGQGGFGTVYVGWLQVGVGTIQVAIKELKETRDKSEFDSLKKEILLMSEVHTHPNILTCYGGCYSKKTNKCYMITEFCSNGDLAKFYKTRAISDMKKIKYLLKISSAVEHLHNKGVVHRDLKPENILVNEANDVLVCDFGTSKHEETMNGTLTGSTFYLPPEYMDDESKIIPQKVDVYAFGIIIWELWNEEKPFSKYLKEHKQNQFHMLFLVSKDNKRPDITNDKTLSMPKMLFSLMVKCWDRDPLSRPENFTTITKTLSSIYKKEKKRKKRKSKRY